MGGQTVRKSQKVVRFTHVQLTCDQLASTCVGWPNAEKLRRLAYEFKPRPKSTQVHASQCSCKWVAKRNASLVQAQNHEKHEHIEHIVG